MLEGLKANDSTKAMLLTEAMNDMEEILSAFGGNKRTVLSYAGIIVSGFLLATDNPIGFFFTMSTAKVGPLNTAIINIDYYIYLFIWKVIIILKRRILMKIGIFGTGAYGMALSSK